MGPKLSKDAALWVSNIFLAQRNRASVQEEISYNSNIYLWILLLHVICSCSFITASIKTKLIVENSAFPVPIDQRVIVHMSKSYLLNINKVHNEPINIFIVMTTMNCSDRYSILLQVTIRDINFIHSFDVD